ncbi:hypothetical protein CTI12_AA393190 [Artemisia annua]|uniref:Uncharacterized protein n=1 Tax=Artemisia annua TaxID=35608 RepID=A0A2U1MDD6_ARTAN|nr:hypothetical protein CTI12_AA393190 [Artemisia annua]
MASNGYLPTLVFSPEQGLNRVLKDSQRLIPNYELREDFIRSGPLNMGPTQTAEQWKPKSGLFDNNQFVMIDQTKTKPALIDIQDCCPNSTLFSYKFPVSGLMQVEKDGLDLLSLSDLTGLKTVTTTDYKPYFPDMGYTDSQLVYPNPEVGSREQLIDFVGDLVRRSEITVHEDGQVSLTGKRREMKDILSVLAEFYLSKSSTNTRKQTVIPYFDSPEKTKHKSQKKKGTRNKTSIKHRSNYSQACESLLSIIVDKNRNSKAAIPVLKKSGPELPNLLTHFSASIAGTGIAVLFSVVCKVASGRVPFCSSKLLNTGLGLGLVWLSWAVNRMRDTIVMINKNSTRCIAAPIVWCTAAGDLSKDELGLRPTIFISILTHLHEAKTNWISLKRINHF